MTIFTITTASASSPWLPSMATPAASNGPTGPRTVPIFIGAEEAYYWSVPWQEDVRESMAALAAGDYVEFDSDDPNDVVRWLLRDDADAD
jgi:hypothetical protein